MLFTLNRNIIELLMTDLYTNNKHSIQYTDGQKGPNLMSPGFTHLHKTMMFYKCDDTQQLPCQYAVVHFCRENVCKILLNATKNNLDI